MNYLVMECHPGYAVVLDRDGRFLKVANRNYQVGQYVSQVEPMRMPKKTPVKKWLYPLAAVAACLVLVITAVFALNPQPYASVYITINPEVRIDVDKNDMVLDVAGVNADGIALIEDYISKGKHLDTVMDELVDRAIEMGYLHQGGQITLTLDAQDQQWVVSHTDALGAHLQEHLNHHMQTTFQVEIQVGHHGEHHHSEGLDYGETDYDDTQPVSQPVQPTTPTEPGKTDYEGHTDYDDHHEDHHDDDDDDDDDGASDYDD